MSAAVPGRWDEDLPALALEGWRIGREHCRGCDGYHQVWGVLRAAGGARGLEREAPVLAPMIRRGLGDAGRVLLAGAADTGVLSLLMRALDPVRPRVTVLDRCPAPLELIGGWGRARGADVRTQCADLGDADAGGRFDLVVAHYTLSFPAPDALAGAVRGLAARVAPGGAALVVHRLPAPDGDPAPQARRDAWLAQARADVLRSGIAARLDPAELDALLARHARSRAARDRERVSLDTLVGLFGDAGLRVEAQVDAGRRPVLVDGAEHHAIRSVALLLRAPA